MARQKVEKRGACRTMIAYCCRLASIAGENEVAKNHLAPSEVELPPKPIAITKMSDERAGRSLISTRAPTKIKRI
jgi:hypothetical protein